MSMILIYFLIVIKVMQTSADTPIALVYNVMTQLKSDEVFTKYLELLIQHEQNKISQLQEILVGVEKRKKLYSNTTFVATNHPIETFRVIRQLKSEQERAKELIEETPEIDYDDFGELGENLLFLQQISSDEIDVTAKNILSLQVAYGLQTDDLAVGKIKGFQATEKMSAQDCKIFLNAAIEQENYKLVIEWALKGLELAKIEKTFQYYEVEELYKSLAGAYLQLGQYENAIETAQTAVFDHDLLSEEYVNDAVDRYLDSLFHGKSTTFIRLLENITEQFRASREAELNPQCFRMNDKVYGGFYFNKDHFWQLCNGQIDMLRYTQPAFKCFFKNDHPALLIAPFKVEIIHFEPNIYIFRDAIYESEMSRLINLQNERLIQAEVGTDKKSSQSLKTRQAKLKFFADDLDDKTFNPLWKRCSLMSNLDVEESREAASIVSYDIGGFYVPHHDFGIYASGNSKERIATLLFYINGPIAGGATVFPKLNLTIPATKGDAVLFFNLFQNSLVGDEMTLHAACPVLLGQKWIFNQFIRADGNQWIRPNTLDGVERRYKLEVDNRDIRQNEI